jgi:hypothetical protein
MKAPALPGITWRGSVTAGEYALVSPHQLVAVRGHVHRFDALQAEEIIQAEVEEQNQDIHPYADPYWAGFQITGW